MEALLRLESAADVLGVADALRKSGHEASRTGPEPDAQTRVPGGDGARSAVGSLGGCDCSYCPAYANAHYAECP